MAKPCKRSVIVMQEARTIVIIVSWVNYDLVSDPERGSLIGTHRQFLRAECVLVPQWMLSFGDGEVREKVDCQVGRPSLLSF